MIKIIDGDLLESTADIIAHQVNCQGKMNSGVAKQIREKYPSVFYAYKNQCDLYLNNPEGLLGMIQDIAVEKNRRIVNLFGQLGYGYDGKQYTNISALKEAMIELRSHLLESETLAMPYKIGCCRGGASWDKVYNIIEEVFEGYNVELWRLDKG